MVTTRGITPNKTFIGGQEFTLGAPEGGWEAGPLWMRVQRQFPDYARYKTVVEPRAFLAAMTLWSSKGSTGEFRHGSLNDILVRDGYRRGDLPADVIHEDPEAEEVIVPMTQQERWARREREEAEGFRRAQERERRLAQAEKAEADERDAGRWERVPRETFPVETKTHRRANRPSDQPEGRRLRNLKQKVKAGLFGSIAEADEATPRRMTQREIAALRQNGRKSK